MRRLVAFLVAVAVGTGTALLVAPIVPTDLALRVEPKEGYRLETYGNMTGIPAVARAELLPHVLSASLDRDPAWRAAALTAGDLVVLDPGTLTRVLRVGADEVGHPAMRVEVLGGPQAGARLFVSRWNLRHPHGAGRRFFALGLPALAGAVVGLLGGIVCWAALAFVSVRRDPRASR